MVTSVCFPKARYSSQITVHPIFCCRHIFAMVAREKRTGQTDKDLRLLFQIPQLPQGCLGDAPSLPSGCPKAAPGRPRAARGLRQGCSSAAPWLPQGRARAAPSQPQLLRNCFKAVPGLGGPRAGRHQSCPIPGLPQAMPGLPQSCPSTAPGLPQNCPSCPRAAPKLQQGSQESQDQSGRVWEPRAQFPKQLFKTKKRFIKTFVKTPKPVY